MQLSIQFTRICEKHNEPHPDPLTEVWTDVMDIATDTEEGTILIRFRPGAHEGEYLQLHRACVLRIEADI